MSNNVQGSSIWKTILIIFLVLIGVALVLLAGFAAGSYLTTGTTEAQPPVSESTQTFLPIPTPAPGEPSATATANVNVRTGPGTHFNSYGLMQAGTSAKVVGVNPEYTWWAIDYPPGNNGRGWVSADYVTVNNVDDVPVIP